MAKYHDAIVWMAEYDDTEWAEHDKGSPLGSLSVTGAMVADLFGKSDEQVRIDVRKELKRRHGRKK